MKQLIGIPLFLLLLQLLGSSKIWSSRGIATLSAPLVAVAFVAILDPTTATNSATAGKIDTNSNNYREGIPHSRRGQSRNSNSKSSPVDNRHLDEDFLQRQAEMELIRNSWEYQLKKIRRAVYLLVLFAPVLFTAGFAYLSVFFRNYIWFSLLSKTIGYSGAVRVLPFALP